MERISLPQQKWVALNPQNATQNSQHILPNPSRSSDHDNPVLCSDLEIDQSNGLDCKIFWEHTFASSIERNFGFQFAEPGEIWRIRQITAEICRICQICPATLKIKLNCNFWKFAIKALLKNVIRYQWAIHYALARSRGQRDYGDHREWDWHLQ